MRKTIFIFVTIVAAFMAAVACKKTETPIAWQQTYETYVRAAEVQGNTLTFGFISPYDWTVSWEPVGWIEMKSELSGPASQDAKDWQTIFMNVQRWRKATPVDVKFVVTAGGVKHDFIVTFAAPVLPESPLEIALTEDNFDAEKNCYIASIPDKYEITVKEKADWLHVINVDYEKNLVSFTADDNAGVDKRTGAIEIHLSDDTVLGNILFTQEGISAE